METKEQQKVEEEINEILQQHPIAYLRKLLEKVENGKPIGNMEKE